jgi:hypothetical protein
VPAPASKQPTLGAKPPDEIRQLVRYLESIDLVSLHREEGAGLSLQSSGM